MSFQYEIALRGTIDFSTIFTLYSNKSNSNAAREKQPAPLFFLSLVIDIYCYYYLTYLQIPGNEHNMFHVGMHASKYYNKILQLLYWNWHFFYAKNPSQNLIMYLNCEYNYEWRYKKSTPVLQCTKHVIVFVIFVNSLRTSVFTIKPKRKRYWGFYRYDKQLFVKHLRHFINAICISSTFLSYLYCSRCICFILMVWNRRVYLRAY